MLLAADHPSPPSRRDLRHFLQLGAFATVLLVVTLVIGLCFTGNSPFSHLFGDDLVPSYMAGTFVRQGHSDKLMDLHAAARARRNAAALDSADFRAAVMDLERIEIRIAAIDRAADPPLG